MLWYVIWEISSDTSGWFISILVCFAEERLLIILNEVRGETKLRQKQREELLRKIKQLQSRAHQRREQGETNSCLRSLPKFAGRAESAAGKNTSSMSPNASYPSVLSFSLFLLYITYFCFLFNSFFLLFLYCFLCKPHSLIIFSIEILKFVPICCLFLICGERNVILFKKILAKAF